jgi:CheY-like chemotaxis protein
MGVRAEDEKFTEACFATCLTKPVKPAQMRETLLRVISGNKRPARPAPTPTKMDPATAARLPLRVLLCDDNAVNQKVATRLLQQMGYRPDLAGNGIEALAALDRQSYDLIFMDLMMPEMGGLEATAAIRERQKNMGAHPHCKSPMIIVAMTASAMQGDREKCLEGGMDDYLSKPVRPEDLRVIIERWGEKAARVEAPAPEPEPEILNEADLEQALAMAEKQDAAASGYEDAGADPVDMERLHDFTDGNPESLKELANLYIKQTSEQLEQLQTAVKAGSTQDVRRLAHSCAGASATCGMRQLVPLLRELERQGYEGNLTSAPRLSIEALKEFERIRSFLQDYMARHCDLVTHSQS